MTRRVSLTIIGVLLIVATTAIAKARAVPAMVTHVDDVGVAVTLLESQAVASPAAVAAGLARNGGHGPLALLVRGATAVGAAPVIAKIGSSLAVSQQWTYAPAQFLLTGALIHRGLSYQQLLVRGRFPSLLFATLVPLLLALIGWRVGGERRAALALLTAAIGACSIELSLHAAQMENYALGTLAATALLMLLVVSAEARVTPGRAVGEACVLALLTWCQYQLLFMLPAYALARGWQSLHTGATHTGATHTGAMRSGATRTELTRTALTRATIWGALPLVVSSAALYHYFLYLWAGAGVSWNAGPHQEYLFAIPQSAGVGAALTYLATFFIGNTIATITAVTAVLPDTSPAASALGLLSTGLAVVGIRVMWRSGTVVDRSILLLSGTLALTWVALIGIRALTLSPTRHALIWLPFLALFIARAITARGTVAVSTAVSTVAAAAMVGAYLSAMPTVMADRTNPFHESELVALADSTQADLIVGFNCTDDLALMPALRAPFFHKACSDLPQFGTFRRALGPDEPRRILFVNSTAPMRADDFRQVQRSMQVILKRPVLAHAESSYTRTDLRRVEVPGGSEWKRGIIYGGAGLFVTLYELAGEHSPAEPSPAEPRGRTASPTRRPSRSRS